MITIDRLMRIFPLFLVLAFGCGSNNPNAPASVSGEVTYKGSPVRGGTVTFHSQDAGSYKVMIHPDGTYSGTDLPAGEMLATIETESAKTIADKSAYGDYENYKLSPPPDGRKTTSTSGQYVEIPEKYANKNRSGLKVTLTSGRQTHNFDLTE
jgi:hypothetical protein